MARLSKVRQELETYLNDNYSATEIAWDNVVFNQTNDAWIRAVLIPTTTENVSLGGLSKRYNGIFWIQIFSRLTLGTKLAYDIAEEIEDLFSNKIFGEVICYASEITRTGNEGKGWFQLNVKTPFWSHEII